MVLSLMASLLITAPAASAASGLDDRPASLASGQQAEPYYPKALRDAGVKGEVVVEVTVDRYNNVSRPVVIRADRPQLEPLAIEAVMGWEYEAAIVNGQVQESRLPVTVTFDPAGYVPPKGKAAGKRPNKPQSGLPAKYQYDEPPVQVRFIKPVYPYDFLVKSKVGRATVTFIVDPQGDVHAAKVESASMPEFGAATVAMAEALKFEPATKDGQPCWAVLTYQRVFNQIGNDSPVDLQTKELLDELERASPRIYSHKEIDAMPAILHRVGPEIPDDVIIAGQPVKAEIEIIVDHSGRALLPRIVSSTHAGFGWAAATAASRWIFAPALKDGKPVYLRVRVPFTYTPSKQE